MTYRYRADNIINSLRRHIKKIVPQAVILLYRKFSRSGEQFSSYNLLFDDSPFPWSSPNVWHEVVSFYTKKENPTIFEYGTGASTIQHVKNLLQMNTGHYIGVEYNPEWFWIVSWSLLRAINQMNYNTETSVTSGSEALKDMIDFNIAIGNVRAVIKLRAKKQAYVNAFHSPGDVIIVDGAHRKECVQHILGADYIVPGSLLMLMEAGRGHPDWWEGQLHGDNDYTDELNRMLNLGGTILHGNGVDNWPGCRRKSPRPPAYHYPYEACKLIIPQRIL